ATLSMEFLALANHRKAVQAEVKRVSEQIRIVLTAGLTRHFQERGYKPSVAPIVAIVLMSSASQNLKLEAALGIALGHGETYDFIESCLRRSEEATRAAAASLPATSGASTRVTAAASPAASYTVVQRRKSRNTSRKS